MTGLLPESEQVPGGLYFLPDRTAEILANEAVAAIEAQIEKAVANVKAGVYRCPWGCGTPGYPAPKWKTEAGFRGHLAKCPMRPKPEDLATPAKSAPVAVVTSDADWDRRHAGQDWAASAEAQP